MSLCNACCPSINKSTFVHSNLWTFEFFMNVSVWIYSFPTRIPIIQSCPARSWWRSRTWNGPTWPASRAPKKLWKKPSFYQPNSPTYSKAKGNLGGVFCCTDRREPVMHSHEIYLKLMPALISKIRIINTITIDWLYDNGRLSVIWLNDLT